MTGQLVTKFKYVPLDARGSRGGYAKYIATREGVEKIDDSHRYAPATKKQQALAENLLKEFPDAVQLPEYETYRMDATRENFSEFLDRVMEDHAEEVLSLRSYTSYIALRPGAERTGRHGLFTNDGEEVVLDQVSKELNEHPGNVWTGIISLKREDAERLGFDSGERWRTLLRSHVCELAEDLKIELSHLRWYAAFHNEGHHPHVHLIAWSEDPREGYLSRQGVLQFRSAIARDVFAQDLLEIYQQETMLRDELRANGKKQLEKLMEKVRKDGYENPEVGQLLLTLARRLHNTKGKKVYGYLRHDLRDMMNDVVKHIAEDPRIQELYISGISKRRPRSRCTETRCPIASRSMRTRNSNPCATWSFARQ